MSDESDAVDIEIEGDEDADLSPEEPTEESTGADSTPSDDTATDVLDRLADVDDDLASEVRNRIDTLTKERDEAASRVSELDEKLKRTQADFQNYKKRAKKRQQSIQDRATEDLVERLVPVRDNLRRALDQDDDADIRGGVESTLTELDRVLEEENVEAIEPTPGEEVDPHRHEVLMRVESEQPAESIAESYRPGYQMGEKVIREAQVTVSDGEDTQ